MLAGLLSAFSACGAADDPTSSDVALAGSGGADSGGAGSGGDDADDLSLVDSGSGGSGEDGCQKVDFLFVIDNSVSMGDQQQALIASFPGFIDTIQTRLSAKSDYHIMVTDTDDVTRCTPAGCSEAGDSLAQTLCVQAEDGYACETPFDPCDNTIGAGVVHPAGDGASNAVCNFVGGQRYITGDEPDLGAAFECAALVGLAGDPRERPMDSLVAAVSPELNGSAGCNQGFLRDDAILVVTFISDDGNYEDAGTPKDWYDAVVAAKGGNADAVVMLGLTPGLGDCAPGAAGKGEHWSEYIALWGARGLEASVCSLDYAPFFDEAVSVIDETCEDFEPPK